MRTDSTNLSDEAVGACRDLIQGEFAHEYLPDNPIRYGSREGAQEAHEAIRPSDVRLRSDQLSAMDADAERLYDLIWRQFVACQMTPARYLSTTLVVSAADCRLTAKGRVIEFDGFTRVQPPAARKGDDAVLPPVAVGDALTVTDSIRNNTSPSRPPATVWSSRELGNVALVAPQPTRRLSPRFKIAAMFDWRIVGFTLKRWATSSQSVCRTV